MSLTIVVGGGLIGMLTARSLAQSGAEVVLYEKGEIGRESSWAGGGIISPLYPWRYDDAVTQLARWGQDRYEGLASELLDETGVDPEYQKSGLLLLGVEGDERTQAERWAKRFGYKLEYLSESEVMTLQPNITSTGGAVWMPEVAQMRNPRLLQAIRKSIESMGVVIHEGSPVSAINTENGLVKGISVSDHEVAAPQVVVAGGAWSAEILAKAGIDIEVSPVRGQMLLFQAIPGVLEHIVLSGNRYLIPRADGRILVGSTLENVGFEKGITDEGREDLYEFATTLLPALREYPIETQWSGLRPGTREGVPYIGECGIKGLYVNAGHFRNGVVIGLASVRLLVDLMTGQSPIFEPAPYACQ